MTAINELSELRQQVESLLAKIAQTRAMSQFHKDNHLAAEKEIERLTECLKAANAQAEHFEHEWYLVGNERDQLRARVAELEHAIEILLCDAEEAQDMTGLERQQFARRLLEHANQIEGGE